jgi:RraA family protein
MTDSLSLLNPLTTTQLLGTAITVKVPIGDNLLFHEALDIALPGDVIVVDGAGDLNRSLAGELMMRFAQEKGLAGVIVDGCVRDLQGIQTLTMPVYAIGITPQGPYKNGPGEVNVPIACAGQVVFPGDILVGDRDGIVVIRAEIAHELASIAQRKKMDEDSSLSLMCSNFDEYTKQHLESTAKRMEGREPMMVNTFWDESDY